MAQTHASDLPQGFLSTAEVENADARVAAGEFADRDAALAAIRAERTANTSVAEQERAAASFPPAGAAPSIGEVHSTGAPPVDAEPEPKPEPDEVSEPEVVEVDEPEVDEPEPEPETKGRRR